MDREKVIKGLEWITVLFKNYERHAIDDPEMQALYDAIALLKAQEAKPVKHIHEEYPEHLWAKDEDGEIDEWVGEDRTSTHHGPVCERCGDSFCVGCEPDGYETHKKCVIDKYECPTCGRGLWRNQKYCDECGQAVKWE